MILFTIYIERSERSIFLILVLNVARVWFGILPCYFSCRRSSTAQQTEKPGILGRLAKKANMVRCHQRAEKAGVVLTWLETHLSQLPAVVHSQPNCHLVFFLTAFRSWYLPAFKHHFKCFVHEITKTKTIIILLDSKWSRENSMETFPYLRENCYCV